MDRVLTKNEQGKNNRRWIWRGLFLLLLLIAAVYFLRGALATKIDAEKMRFGMVETGPISAKITASGLILPAYERQINAPIMSEIKELLRRPGDEVKKGDVLIKLDTESTLIELEGLQDQLKLRKNKVERLKLEYEKNLKELAYNDEIQSLQISSLEASLADTKRLQKIGGSTEEEVERTQMQLEIARIEKSKLENQLNFNRSVIEKDKENLELEVRIQEKVVTQLRNKLRKSTLKASSDGVLTWINENIGKTVNEGDALIRLADLNAYRVEASCADRYSRQLQVGMPVQVVIGKTILKATIGSIRPEVVNNTVKFDVLLEEADHSLLRPNLRVEVYLITSQKENALLVANGPAITGAVQQDLFVVRGAYAEKTKVKIGLTNRTHVELMDTDLRVGDKVILSDMKLYDHLDQISLKAN